MAANSEIHNEHKSQ